MDRRAAVTQLKAVYAVLNADWEAARQYGMQHPTPYALRSSIRAFFALVEGMTYQLRLTTVASTQNAQELLTAEDHRLLQDVALDIGLQVPDQRFQRQSFADNFRHALKVYPKIHGAQFQPDLSGKGWVDFRSSVLVRDRLMHPKSLASLDISTDEDRAMRAAIDWWRNTMASMFDACDAADAYWRAKSTANDAPENT